MRVEQGFVETILDGKKIKKEYSIGYSNNETISVSKKIGEDYKILTKEESIDSDITSKHEYKYDDNGRIIKAKESVYINSDGKFHRFIERGYEYGDFDDTNKNVIITTKRYATSGKLMYDSVNKKTTQPGYTYNSIISKYADNPNIKDIRTVIKNDSEDMDTTIIADYVDDCLRSVEITKPMKKIEPMISTFNMEQFDNTKYRYKKVISYKDGSNTPYSIATTGVNRYIVWNDNNLYVVDITRSKEDEDNDVDINKYMDISIDESGTPVKIVITKAHTVYGSSGACIYTTIMNDTPGVIQDLCEDINSTTINRKIVELFKDVYNNNNTELNLYYENNNGRSLSYRYFNDIMEDIVTYNLSYYCKNSYIGYYYTDNRSTLEESTKIHIISEYDKFKNSISISEDGNMYTGTVINRDDTTHIEIITDTKEFRQAYIDAKTSLGNMLKHHLKKDSSIVLLQELLGDTRYNTSPVDIFNKLIKKAES